MGDGVKTYKDAELVTKLNLASADFEEKDNEFSGLLWEAANRIEEAFFDDYDVQEILVCAGRYALGRRTHVVAMVVQFIKNFIPKMETKYLQAIMKDIEQAEDLGDPHIDAPLWVNLKICIKIELGIREREGRL